LFFPVGSSGPALAQIYEAKAVCARCPVREACLRFALDTGQNYGIWGGLTEDERHKLRRKERRTADGDQHKRRLVG
jgi:WhiB family redox-sensing transcriptional regulator